VGDEHRDGVGTSRRYASGGLANRRRRAGEQREDQDEQLDATEAHERRMIGWCSRRKSRARACP
jgi:hypothetical protein